MRLIFLAPVLLLAGCGAQYSVVLHNTTTEPLEAALLQNEDDQYPAARASLAAGGRLDCRISRSDVRKRLLRVHIPEYGPHAVQYRTIAHGERLRLRAVRTDHGFDLINNEPPWQGPAYADRD